MRVSASGQILSKQQMESVQSRLVRDVALALDDTQLRALVLQAIQESPFREGKLHFRTFLEGDGAPLLAAVAAARQTTEPDVFRSLDSLVDLEFYMPVPDHRAAWDGGSNLIVAGALRDHVIPVAADLAGNAVTIASAEEPPATPALVLVPVETNFGARPPSTTAEQIGSTSGVYMTYMSVWDDYEGWGMGSPEFEVHPYVRNGDVWSSVSCSGSEVGPPYYWDYNDISSPWSGEVLAVTGSVLQGDTVAFQIWEDDTEPCGPLGRGRPPKADPTLKEAILETVVGAGIVYYAFDEYGFWRGFWTMVVVGGVVFALENDLFHADEFVGSFQIPDGCWEPTGSRVVAVKDTNMTTAWVGIDPRDVADYREPKCPPPPMNVWITGPRTAPDYSWVSVTANVSNYTAPLSYAWKVNGTPACGSSYECTERVDGYTTFEVTVTDADNDSAYDSHTVSPECTDGPGCTPMAPRKDTTGIEQVLEPASSQPWS